MLFATEILLPEISNRTFLPVVIATGAATYTGRVLLGAASAFTMPRFEGALLSSAWPMDLLLIVSLGAASGLAAWAFIRLLAFFEDWFPTLPGGPYAQVAAGMAVIGAMMVGFTHLFGHPFINGVGYGVIQSILEARMTIPALLVILFVAKIVATSISLGSGASGGIFSPLLFIGATLGAGLGFGALTIAPHLDLSPASCAIIGMAAMVGAGTGGVMTAIVMIFEMTRDYAVIVPVIIAVAFGSGVRRALIRDTIYTIKLRHRGHHIPQDRHANLYLVQQARAIMETEFIVAEPGAKLLDVLERRAAGRRSDASDRGRTRESHLRHCAGPLRTLAAGPARPVGDGRCAGAAGLCSRARNGPAEPCVRAHEPARPQRGHRRWLQWRASTR